MNTYETTATVEDHGQVHLAGVPFGPRTQVAVTIRAKAGADANPPPAHAEEGRVRMKTNWVQETAGILGWKGDPEELRRLALSLEFDLEDEP